MSRDIWRETGENEGRNGIKILTGRSNPDLANKVAQIIGKGIDEPISKFPDGERRVVINEPLRRSETFIIQPTSPPKVNANLIELLIMIDAAKREMPDGVHAIIPYYGYGRQDRMDRPRTSPAASLVSRLIVEAGADSITTIDLHADQIVGSIKKPWDNLYASSVLVPALNEYGIGDCTVATPDEGGFKRAIKYSELLGSKEDVAIAYKIRSTDIGGGSKTLTMQGDVEGKTVVLVDDILAGGSTLVDAANKMKANGATRIVAAVTHGLFLGDSLEKIYDSPIERVFVTDTIRHRKSVRVHPKIEIVTVADLIVDNICNKLTGGHLGKGYK